MCGERAVGSRRKAKLLDVVKFAFLKVAAFYSGKCYLNIRHETEQSHRSVKIYERRVENPFVSLYIVYLDLSWEAFLDRGSVSTLESEIKRDFVALLSTRLLPSNLHTKRLNRAQYLRILRHRLGHCEVRNRHQRIQRLLAREQIPGLIVEDELHIHECDLARIGIGIVDGDVDIVARHTGGDGVGFADVVGVVVRVSQIAALSVGMQVTVGARGRVLEPVGDEADHGGCLVVGGVVAVLDCEGESAGSEAVSVTVWLLVLWRNFRLVWEMTHTNSRSRVSLWNYDRTQTRLRRLDRKEWPFL